MNIANMPAGSLDTFGDNELLLKSLKDDPAKIRFDAPGPGRWLGALSFNRNGKEYALVGVKLSEDGQRAEFVVFCYDEARPGSEDDKMGGPILVVAPNGNAGAPVAASAAPSGRFYSGNGRYCWNYQDDGAVVLYDTHNSTDESTWTPKWAQRANGVLETTKEAA